MKLTTPDIHFLNAVTDDYENLDLIEKQIAKDLGYAIKREEVKSIARKLIELKLIQAFPSPNQTDSVWLPRKDNPVVESDWFLITQKGRDSLEKEWPGKDL